MKFLLYGAYGYTGEVTAEYAAEYQIEPILAGRNEEKLKALAQKTGYAYRAFDLSNPSVIQEALKDVDVVLHAAGPFVHTAQPMLDACLATNTHYLDITGEIGVFEPLQKQSQAAKDAGIMVLPGAGFDVVPTDCVANLLKKQMPTATHLKLAFWSIGSRVSHGTATTMTENLGESSWVRENGRLKPVPVGHKTLWVKPDQKKLMAMTIPWGDISTAYYSTGIPNIETYMGVHPKQYKNAQRLKYLGWLMRTNWARKRAQKRIDNAPAGPSAEQRKNGSVVVWGEVRDADGNFQQCLLRGPEGYHLTAHTSLIIAKKVLEGKAPLGYQTPASAYGEELVLEAPNVSWKLGALNEDLSA